MLIFLVVGPLLSQRLEILVIFHFQFIKICYVIYGYGLGDGHIIATELGAAGSLAHYESN